MRIGFVGLGLMGLPMAHRLLNAGHELHIHSENTQSIEALTNLGAISEKAILEVARKVEVFCSCRVTPDQSRDVFMGTGGVFSAVSRPAVCIDFATIDPMTSREIGEGMAEVGVDYLDAPISGGPDGATAGMLSIMVGGEKRAVKKAAPIFETFGKQVFHMGDIGSGVTTKLCNNMITITTHALVAEAMVLGVKSGVDARALYEVLSNSTAYSRTLERVVPRHFLVRNFKAAATIDNIMKDLQGALDLAEAKGVQLSLPTTAMKRFVEAAEQGYSRNDIAAVILPMEERAGTSVGPA